MILPSQNLLPFKIQDLNVATLQFSYYEVPVSSPRDEFVLLNNSGTVPELRLIAPIDGSLIAYSGDVRL